jgi:hypothetical protein
MDTGMRHPNVLVPSIWPARIWIALLVMTALLVSCPGGSGGY